MPEFLDVIEANTFWTAPESDIFPLPVVAIALGIGRNKMSQIPVNRIMVNNRTCYRKSDILNWCEVEQAKGKDSLLLKLRAQNSAIGRAEKARSQYYDIEYTRDPKSHYRPSSAKGETKRDKYIRLCNEWLGSHWGRGNCILSELESCNDNERLKELIQLAWDYRKEFIKLRMGLPRGIGLGNWWFEKDFEAVLAARLFAKRERLKQEIKYELQTLKDLEKGILPDYAEVPSNVDKSALINRMILDAKQDIEHLSTELEELG